MYYSGFRVVTNVNLDVTRNEITALIGPSGCGKSTLMRCFNRMNDLVPGAKVHGSLTYHGTDLYGAEGRPGRGAPPHRHGLPEAEPVPEVHLRQHRVRAAVKGKRARLDEIVEKSLPGAALWDEVKDKLKHSAFALSGGQQQRLCIARAHRRRARGHPDGRAVLGARPDRDGEDRRPHGGAEERRTRS